MKKFLVIAAAGGALAIGVPAAFAVTATPQTPTQTIQQESTPAPQERPDREDCPEKDGQGGGDGASGSAATPTPGAEL